MQKDSLKAELEQLGLIAILDSGVGGSSKKRQLEEYDRGSIAVIFSSMIYIILQPSAHHT